MEEHLEHYATTFIEENSTVSAEQNLLNLFKNKRIETPQKLKSGPIPVEKAQIGYFMGMI